MPAWAAGAWAVGAWEGTAWQSAAPVTVPDVVGLSEADAILALEGVGFDVSVSYAQSSTVAAGLVISQDPAGGSESTEGATVYIVVSTGESDVATDPKLIGKRPNVRMRRLQQIVPQEPLPAQITNMPDAPPPPKPLAAGLVLDLLPDPPPKPAVQPALKLVPVEAPVEVLPAEPEPTPAEPVKAAETAPAAPAVEEAKAAGLPTELMDAMAIVLGLQTEKIVGAAGEIAKAFNSVATELAGLRADLQKQRDLEAKNRKRQAEIDARLKGE